MEMTHDLPSPTWGHVLPSGPDWPPTAVCILLAAVYLFGVDRLRRRGDRWPVRRTSLWLAGVLVPFLVSGSGVSRWRAATSPSLDAVQAVSTSNSASYVTS